MDSKSLPFKTDSTINPTNRIQRKCNVNSIQSQIQPLNPQTGFNINCIQRQIQLLNPQIGFNVNSIQRQIQPINPEIG